MERTFKREIAELRKGAGEVFEDLSETPVADGHHVGGDQSTDILEELLERLIDDGASLLGQAGHGMYVRRVGGSWSSGNRPRGAIVEQPPPGDKGGEGGEFFYTGRFAPPRSRPASATS